MSAAALTDFILPFLQPVALMARQMLWWASPAVGLDPLEVPDGTSGVYGRWYRDILGRLSSYIGKSGNLRRRTREHDALWKGTKGDGSFGHYKKVQNCRNRNIVLALVPADGIRIKIEGLLRTAGPLTKAASDFMKSATQTLVMAVRWLIEGILMVHLDTLPPATWSLLDARGAKKTSLGRLNVDAPLWYLETGSAGKYATRGAHGSLLDGLRLGHGLFLTRIPTGSGTMELTIAPNDQVSLTIGSKQMTELLGVSSDGNQTEHDATLKLVSLARPDPALLVNVPRRYHDFLGRWAFEVSVGTKSVKVSMTSNNTILAWQRTWDVLVAQEADRDATAASSVASSSSAATSPSSATSPSVASSSSSSASSFSFSAAPSPSTSATSTTASASSSSVRRYDDILEGVAYRPIGAKESAKIGYVFVNPRKGGPAAIRLGPDYSAAWAAGEVTDVYLGVDFARATFKARASNDDDWEDAVMTGQAVKLLEDMALYAGKTTGKCTHSHSLLMDAKARALAAFSEEGVAIGRRSFAVEKKVFAWSPTYTWWVEGPRMRLSRDGHRFFFKSSATGDEWTEPFAEKGAPCSLRNLSVNLLEARDR